MHLVFLDASRCDSGLIQSESQAVLDSKRESSTCSAWFVSLDSVCLGRIEMGRFVFAWVGLVAGAGSPVLVSVQILEAITALHSCRELIITH